MQKFKRLIECYVPIYACNFRCEYCYIKQNHNRSFSDKVIPFKFEPSYIASCLSVKRLGGTCLINLCAGGETLLSPQTVELAKLLLNEGHFVMIVNNGTCTKQINDLLTIDPSLRNRLWMRFSLHWNELERLNLINMFFDNVNKCKNAGCSIAVEMVASDSYIPHISNIIDVCQKRIKSLPEINIARSEHDYSILTSLNKEDYYKTWSVFNSASFDFKKKTVGVKRLEFCYAGEWSATLDLDSGLLSKCYTHPIQNIFKDPNEPIKFEAIGKNCLAPYCFNSHLFLAMGNIPCLDFPSIAAIRGKECSDGTRWLTKEMEDFVGQKVFNNNKKYSSVKRNFLGFKSFLIKIVDSLQNKKRRKNGK